MGTYPDGEAPVPSTEAPSPHLEATPQLSLRRLLKAAPFRAQALACAFYNLGTMTVLVHGISLLLERGIESGQARLLISVMALLGIAGKVIFGYLADRVSVRYLSAGLYCLQALGILLLVLTHDLTTGYLFVVVAGLSMGGVVTLQSVLVGAYFGVGAFGTIYGILHIMMAGAAAVGPIFAAYLYDLGGGYEPALLIFVGANLLGGILIFLQQDPGKFQWSANQASPLGR
jgi:MFS family permease